MLSSMAEQTTSAPRQRKVVSSHSVRGANTNVPIPDPATAIPVYAQTPRNIFLRYRRVDPRPPATTRFLETVHPTLSDRRPLVSVLSVYVDTVYCGQTVGWIRMSLGTEVGLSPGDIVLGGDPAAPTERGTAPPPHFSPNLLWHGRLSQQLLSSCH